MSHYIFTGGPGVGKTSALNALAAQGFAVIPEVPRIIIEEEQHKEQHSSGYKGIFPWTNLTQFQDLVLARQISLEENIKPTSGSVKIKSRFQDRSCADPLAYMELGQIDIRKDIYDLIENANYTKAFFFHRLPCYVNDAQRKEDDEKAKRIHDKIYEVYDRLGFDIVEVPIFKEDEQDNITARINHILSHLHQEKNREIEQKYKISHSQLREVMKQYHLLYRGADDEENMIYDAAQLLKNQGYLLRIRATKQEHTLTWKGKNKGTKVKDQLEFNIPLPLFLRSMTRILPCALEYHKTRQTYTPLGDQQCKVTLDYIAELKEEFVEIEAPCENQVLLWEKRLGLEAYRIRDSYPGLIEKQKKQIHK